MLIHIVKEDSQDDTVCGEEVCRHCPWGFLWFKKYEDGGFPIVEGMKPCEKCRKLIAG